MRRDRRPETGDRRPETGDRRLQTGGYGERGIRQNDWEREREKRFRQND